MDKTQGPQGFTLDHPPRPDAQVEPCQEYEDWPRSMGSAEVQDYCFDCGWHKDDHE